MENTTLYTLHYRCSFNPMHDINETFEIIILFPIVFFNLLTVICIFKYPTLRNYTNMFVASLASGDIAYGMLALMPAVTIKYSNGTSRSFCILVLSTNFCSAYLSLSNLTLLSIERYIAVVMPFKYNIYVTKQTTSAAILLAWLGNILVTVTMSFFMKWENVTTCTFENIYPKWINSFVFITGFLYIIITIFFYVKVMWIARKQLRAIGPSSKTNNSEADEINKAKMMMIIFGFFICCYIPVVALKVIEYMSKSHKRFKVLKCLSTFFIKINYFINFFVYNICSKQFRKATKHFLCCNKLRLSSNQH
ncbi:adenosine receptor A2a-like [Octopus sinensis]|uniref:Adenosine receptor A2a-like n=1 Tax=Octopus sinensis TaxID=2607531 RepID=A0A7E6FM98_9MOLL|nr:adenosine receptor A2a-like [Octopus sinensis]